MVERYHKVFGTTSSLKFRVLHAISELGDSNKSKIEDFLRDSRTESFKLLPSNLKSITTKGVKDLSDLGYIVEVEGSYRVTEEGARILYEV